MAMVNAGVVMPLMASMSTVSTCVAVGLLPVAVLPAYSSRSIVIMTVCRAIASVFSHLSSYLVIEYINKRLLDYFLILFSIENPYKSVYCSCLVGTVKLVLLL
jgi:hypothetical protein